jgi:formamidopyrimidine-DNA glycosylase
MPELPELTVYADNLRPRVAGKTIAAVEVHHPRALRRSASDDFAVRVKGCAITDVVRRGKSLGFILDSGDRLDVHLMLAGEMYYAEPLAALTPPEPCLTLTLQDGARLTFSDRHYNLHRPQEPKLWVGINQKERLGLDPLDPAFTPDALAALCRAHKLLPIKVLLMDQKLIGGLGNAYVDELLWLASVKPRRVASLMSPEEVAAVHRAVGETLAEALRQTREGVAGEIRGEVRDYFRVHHRGGKPCPRCGTRIVQEYLRERTTNWCPTCQV